MLTTMLKENAHLQNMKCIFNLTLKEATIKLCVFPRWAIDSYQRIFLNGSINIVYCT
uniref:Uncharacterized protein n=1 Tax=Arundo donax TaxID=35708 RepID=A0A0A8Z973_ARUDO